MLNNSHCKILTTPRGSLFTWLTDCYMFLSSLVFILNIQRTFTGITKPHGTSVYLKAGSPLELLGQPQTHVTSCCKSSKVSYLPAISFKHWFESMTLIPIYCLMFSSDKTGPSVDWIPSWHPPFIISWFHEFPRLICHLTVSRRNKFDPKYRCQIFDEQM